MAIGADVSAIGHPDGQAWTFTKGIISQHRLGFQWLDHKADVIQTQTPINPGNSGGPLISEAGSLIGVNSFKTPDAEGLNFSVSADEVKKFLARSGDRPKRNDAGGAKPVCALKEISRFRNKKNDATIVAYIRNVPVELTRTSRFRMQRRKALRMRLIETMTAAPMSFFSI
jgi:S1-C subfamily serine protease